MTMRDEGAPDGVNAAQRVEPRAALRNPETVVVDWRRRVAGPAADDFDHVMSGVLSAVDAVLERRETPPPCGLAVSQAGDLVDLGARSWLGASSSPREVVADLYRIARAEAVACRAVALAQVGRSSGGLALRVDLEHADGVAVTVVLPYTYSRLRRSYVAGEPVVSEGSRRVWRDRPGEIHLRATRDADRDVWIEDAAAG